MRRTDLEFKNEVLHRAAAYKARRAQRRKKLLAGACCLAVCILAAGVFWPGASGENMSAATADCAAPEAADQNGMSIQDVWYGQESAAEAPASVAGTGENNGIIQDALPESVYVLIETAGGECAVLSEEDAWQIRQYLTGPWVDDLTDCASDWTIQIDSESFSYHSECGTFNDIDHFRSLTVSEEDRMAINAILEKYGLETGFAP